MNVNELMILEMIMIDHRYSDIKEFFIVDEHRLIIVKDIIKYVLNNSHHEVDFQKFVDMELSRIMLVIKGYESLH